MSLSIPDFWKLLAASRLQSQERVQQLAAEFAQASAADPANARPLAQWLVTNKKLSRYQATVLLAGRSGPFFFGDYKVHDRLDKGRLAGCFRAQHVPTGHPVLLQFLAGAAAGDAALWTAIVEQTRARAGTSSPFVQRTFEPVELPKLKFVVSEDLRGAALDEYLDEHCAKGPLPSAEACRLARQAALGLAALHDSGRIHGDVRPPNLWLMSAANAPAFAKFVVDPLFIPRPLDLSSDSGTRPLALRADYLAPELAIMGRSPDALADIYALGCTLYSLLAGSPPFPGGDVQAKLLRHASEPFPPLEPLGVTPALAQIVASTLAKKASVRLPSAAELAEQLAAFVEPADLSLAPPAPPATLERYLQSLAPPPSTTDPVGWAPPTTSAPEPAPEIIPAASPAPLAVPFSPSATESALGISLAPSNRPRTSAADIMRRRQQQQRRNVAVGLTLLALLAIAGGAASFLFREEFQQQFAAITGSPAPAPPVANPAAAPAVANTSTNKVGETSLNVGNQSVPKFAIADDGHALWAAPTSGEPISFAGVPPEAQVFLHFRPSEMLATEEGQRVLSALGPTFAAQRQAFESASGFKFDQIERLLLTLHNNDAKFPRLSFVVTTIEPFTPEQLLEKWGNPAATGEGPQKFYASGERAFYIPAQEEHQRTFVMGEPRDIKEVAAIEGSEPVAIFPQIKRLQRTSDSQRHFTLIFFPQFLFNDDGEPLFAAERTKIRQPLQALLGDYVQAASVTAQVGDQFYFELRMLASLDAEPHQLAQDLRARLEKVPTTLEDYFVALSPPPYWKKLSFRYPSMVRDLLDHLRIGVENDQAIANSVLPASAAHNLVLGGELLVATAPGPASVAAAAPAANGPKTIEEALQRKTSYTFDSQSLEFAMSGLADDVKSSLSGAPFDFAIKIIGADLEGDGITRNQTVRDFKQENQTVADILTALVRKANPITTVKDPSEPDQRLVWVVAPNPDNPKQSAVLITTRAAAATKKYTLPAPFVAKKP